MKSAKPSADSVDVVAAGHICLDIIPDLAGLSGNLGTLLAPGSLSRIGPAVLSTGGAVSNVGLALHRLGVATRLMGKIGDDPFGQIVRSLLDASGAGMSRGMIVAPGEHTSYSVVISPKNSDRVFLHHSGANDTFGSADVLADKLQGKLFHFGYPPIMKRLFSDGGHELGEIFERARSRGMTTSLDMTHVDHRSDAGRVDWAALVRHVMPAVDIFMPSLDEILFMLGREVKPEEVNGPLLDDVAQSLIDMGCPMIIMKLGDQGLYVRTATRASQLPNIASSDWAARQLLAPCFSVDVAGTTGAGDCTIAGFLAGLIHKLPAEKIMSAAVGTGAFCVEKPDAVSGVPTWDRLQQRIAGGWARRDVRIPLPEWKWDQDRAICHGPQDASRQ